jgi:NADPH-dependent curcumin reductase CurA
LCGVSSGVTVLPDVPSSLSPSVFLGPLGMNGLTAYFGFLDVGKPKAGDTVLVTGAAGATGSLVAQIAKNVVGCDVICVAGGKDKCDWLASLGFTNVVDYKEHTNMYKAISDAAPKGIDVFFDNGTECEAVLSSFT